MASNQTFENVLQAHVSVVGITGSGKTHMSRYLHRHTLRKSIFWNVQDEDGVAGHRTEDWDVRLLAEHDKINLIPPEDPDEATRLLDEIRRDLFEMGKRVSAARGRLGKWCIVFVDEAQEVAPEGVRSSPLHSLIKRGRRHGITVVVITQAPADVAKGVLKQCTTHIVFRIGRYEGTYFETYNLPVVPGQLKGHQFVIATEESCRGPYVL